MPLLRMRDYLTVVRNRENKRYLFECRDSSSDTGHSLAVDIEATHAGIVNGNMRFYRPDRMQAGTYTWVPKGKPALPMLLHHDRKSEVQGRVVTAKYIDTSHDYAGRGVKNLHFYDGRQKKMDLYKSVDWVVRNLMSDADYKGLGYIKLGVNITHPDAIAKVLRDEYLTVSAGFATDSAVCSICHQDWAADGKCDHRLGSTVDEAPVFLITGNQFYEECSFVTFGADPWAVVTGKKALAKAADSIAHRAFFMGLPAAEQNSASLLYVADSLDVDIQLVPDYPESQTNAKEDDHMDLNALLDEIKSDALVKDRALAIRTELEAFRATDAKDKNAKRALSTLNATIKTKGWDATDGAPSKATVEAKIEALASVLPTLADNAARQAYVEALETDANAFGVAFTAPVLEDAADAGAAAQPDPAVPAAAEDSATVIDPKLQICLDELFKAEDEKKYPNKDRLLKHVEATQALHNSLTDDEKYLLRGTLSSMLQVFYAESELSWMKNRIVECGDAVLPQKELDTLHDAIEKFEADAQTAATDKAALMAANKVLIEDQKKGLATVLVMGAVLLGEKGYQGLTDAEIADRIQRKSARSLISLRGSVNDLQEKLPGFQAASESKPPSNEGTVRQVDDNVQVQDTAAGPDKTGSAADSADAQAGANQDIANRALHLLDRKERQRRLLNKRYESLTRV